MSIAPNQRYGDILMKDYELGAYPMNKLKRVDRPTTKITNSVHRFDEREQGFHRAGRGDYGPVAARERNRFVIKTPLSASLADMTVHLASIVDGPVAASRAPIPDDPAILSRHIKCLGYFLRADIVGISELPQYAVYTHSQKTGEPLTNNHKYAISVVIDQDYRTMNGSSGNDWISNSQSFLAYSNTAYIACIIANYIRRLGYSARAHHASDYQVVIPPLLLHSGIGEMCRVGVVLNPFLGFRFKAAAVTTDLPLFPDKPVDFGLQEFCQKCKKCAIECPSKAIPLGDKEMYNGYEVWKLDVSQCTKFRVTNPNGAGCAHCIKVCPWNKPEGVLHDMVRWMAKNMPFVDSAIIKMDDVFGYGKQKLKDKWWFDLEEIGGVMHIPKKSKQKYW